MLLNLAAQRPRLETVRRIKRTLREALGLPDSATLTVAQLACLEADCAPLETVIGLLRPGQPPLQHRLHKAADAITPEDLLGVCRAWGLSVSALSVSLSLSEN